MVSKRDEPSALKRGKRFHKEVQSEWEAEFEHKDDSIDCEHQIDGSRRRMDIRVSDNDGLVGVLEIKSTNWEQMSASQVKRRVQKHAEQVWVYIESELAKGVDVSPGIILLGLPADPERVALVEELFDEEGIAVAWQDESIAEARARHMRASPN